LTRLLDGTVLICHSSYSLPLSHPLSTLFPYTTLFRSTSGSPSRPTRSTRARSATTPSRDSCTRASAAAGRSGRRCTSSTTRWRRSEEHTSELQSRENLVCRLLLEKKNKTRYIVSIQQR